MAGPLDNIFGGLQQGAIQAGNFLKSFGQAPSQPVKSSQPPLPSPTADPAQPQRNQSTSQQSWAKLGSSLQNSIPNDGSKYVPGLGALQVAKNFMGSPFSRDVGLQQLGSNMLGQDASNKNTMAGQLADPNNPINQFKQAVNDINPLKGPASYVSNVLNAGVVDPIQLAGNPQMWFAEDQSPRRGPSIVSGPSGIMGIDAGHNYLRDAFSPVVKRITGEDVPPTPMTLDSQAKALKEQNDQLYAAQNSLTPESSPEDVAAFNSKLVEYNAKVDAYTQVYNKSQDWWANSNTAKALSVFGQIATFPAGMAAGMITFVPQLMKDPVGTGESLVNQVTMAADFTSKLMDPEARQHMSAQELAANLSNVAMLAGMLFGPKKLGGMGLLDKRGSKDVEMIKKIQSDLHQTTPEYHMADPASTVQNTPVNKAIDDPAMVKAHLEQRRADLTDLQSRYARSDEPLDRALIQKQINDIQDELSTIDKQSPPRLAVPIGNAEFQRYSQSATPRLEESGSETGVRGTNRAIDNADAIQDVGREMQTEQRPQYTAPVYPKDGFPERPVDTLLKDLQDFSRPAIQAKAIRERPQDYASPSARTTEGPITKFENMDPKTIESIGRDSGYRVVSPDKATGNVIIDPRTGKAIEFGKTAHLDGLWDFRKTIGDGRDSDQLLEDMMNAGFIKGSDMDAFMLYAIDRADPENLASIGKAIQGDLRRTYEQGRPRPMPYQIVEINTNRAYNITAQEFAANNFDLAKTIAQQRRLMPRAETTAGPIPEKITPTLLKQIVEAVGWKIIPANKVEYGWLFPNNKGADLGLIDQRGDHQDLAQGIADALDKNDITKEEWIGYTKDAVQLRRGYGKDIDDHYFFVRDWTSVTKKIVEDYLLSKSKNPPTYIRLESNPGQKGIKASAFSYEDFKDNDFKLDGLMNRKPTDFRGFEPGAFPEQRTTEGPKEDFPRIKTKTGKTVVAWTERQLRMISSEPAKYAQRVGTLSDIAQSHGINSRAFPDGMSGVDQTIKAILKAQDESTPARGPLAETGDGPQMGPWLYDKFLALQKADNRIKMFEDRIDQNAANGKNTRKDETELLNTLNQIQKVISELPDDIPPQLTLFRDRLLEKLNEKGYPTTIEDSAEGTVGQTGQKPDSTPPGAPKGSTLATVIPAPKAQGSVAVWTPDAITTRALSTRERGRVELKQELNRKIQEVTDDYGEASDLRKLEVIPANWNRRVKEIISTFKVRIDDIDPQGDMPISHLIIDHTLSSEANYDPRTGAMKVNPLRMAPVSWIRGAAGSLQRSLSSIREYASDEGLATANDWLEAQKKLTQSQSDFLGIMEEVLHKKDIGDLTPQEYLTALSRLPSTWWDWAGRSGLGDILENGLISKDDTGEFTLRTIYGDVVQSWVGAYIYARRGWLDDRSFNATLQTFYEARVRQSLNYHGAPGYRVNDRPVGLNYRVPEVMLRELQNPSLIEEGARITGDDLPRYYAQEIAPGLPRQKALYEAQTADSTGTDTGAITARPTTTVPDTSAIGGTGRSPGDKENLGTQDFPQVGDRLEVDLTNYPNKPEKGIDVSKLKPNWTPFWNHPIRDAEDAARAAQIVNSRGRIFYSKDEFMRNFRVINPQTGGQVRVFKGDMPTTTESPQVGPGTVDVRENPETFHGVPTPEITPTDLSSRTVNMSPSTARTGFSQRALNLTEEYDVPPSIGKGYRETKSVGGKLVSETMEYKPLLELNKTGYPGTWEDFLQAMGSDETSIEYITARPYWDKLAPKYQEAWMKAMQAPGVEGAAISNVPKTEEVTMAEMQTPAFLARQVKIQEYRDAIATSGPILDKLSKTINTRDGLETYAKAKGKIAAMVKYVSLPPSVPHNEAVQLAGAEFSKVVDDITRQPDKTGLPRDPQVEAMTRPKNLTSQLQPVIRSFIESRVTMKDTTGRVAKGYYQSLDKFLDAYAFGEESAKKLYRLLPKTSKAAIKSLAEQYPQSFKMGMRDRPDQTSIPMSMQAAPEHINQVKSADFRAVAQSAVRAVVRHGSTEYNEKGLIRGHDDPPLSSLGRLQARELGRAYAGRQNLAIVTHDLSRAQDTANAIAKAARGSKVTIDPDLRPWNPGDELTGAAVSAASPKMIDWMQNQPDYVPPGGESWNQFKTRFLPAFARHLSDGKDVFVVSTRNQRLVESWINAGMPADFSIDESPMLTSREIGPGGIMALGNKSDGSYTITNKVSQAPSNAEALAVPRVPKNIVPADTSPVTVTLNRNKPMAPPPEALPVQVAEQVRINFKIGEQAEAKSLNTKGEITPAVRKDVADRIDAIVADPSIDPTNPLKIAAVRAQMARQGIQDAKAMGVPKEALDEQVRQFTVNIGKASELLANKAVEDAKAAPLVAPVPVNKMIFDTTLIKAKDHQNRMMQGEDWSVSASRAAKEIILDKTQNPLGDMIGMIKDGSQGLLSREHFYNSLSPAFKDIFINPKAVELLRQENLSEPPKQGLLPVESEMAIGADVPVKPLPTNKQEARQQATQRKAQAAPVQQSRVTPAIAETLRAHTPDPTPPVEESFQNLTKKYNVEIGETAKMTTAERRRETAEIHEGINTESPDLFSEGEEIDMRDIPDSTPEAMAQQVESTNTGGGTKGGGGGRGKKPPEEPLKGWDEVRDHGSSFGGDFKQLSHLMDRALKSQANLLNASYNTPHPMRMAVNYISARVARMYTGDQIQTLLTKLYDPKDIPRNQAMQRAIGGDEVKRQASLKLLPLQDQAIANMMHAYHISMGRIGVRPETHVFDKAQDGYLRRQVLLDEEGKPITEDMNGSTKWSKKLSIAYERRQRKMVIGKDEDGKPIIRTENYYKDLDDLRDKGFKVEESIANLWKGHWDQFSNMNLTHQLIRELSTLKTFKEDAIKPGYYNVGGKGLKRGDVQWIGRVLVPNKDQLGGDYKGQVRTVVKGPFANALRDYQVYKPVADVLESVTTARDGASVAEQAANLASNVNGIYKVFKFGFNPIHAFNLASNVWALGTNGLLDPATYNPGLLVHRIYGRTDELLSEKGSYKNWDGTKIHGTDMINKILEWGGVLPKEIVDVANLGGLTGTLSRNVPGFRAWHNVMWQNIAWKGHIGLILHQMDVMQKMFEKEVKRPMNEAEFENAGRLATDMSKYAMGFLSKTDMTRDWQVYGNALFFANSWTVSQLRLLGMTIPDKVPGAKYLANIGGGERYNEILSESMKNEGAMTQEGLDAINGMEGMMARRMMLGGAAKLLAMSVIGGYIASYLGNSGQAQGPWQNFQRDPTHTFDGYLGTDQQTGKDKWAHNPLFGMQQEMLLYMLQAVKEYRNGGNPYDVLTAGPIRFTNKFNPVLTTSLGMAINRNLSLFMQGYGDRSNISSDKNVIAIRRALDATGKNPFPESFTNNLIYAVRNLFPSPGFPTSLDTQNGTAPNATNATLGNVLNALGPGKVLGIGDLINAIQSGDFSSLTKTDLGGLAQFMTGSRVSTSSTPEQIILNNQIGSSISTRDARDQAIADMVQAAKTGDWKTVAQITQQLNLTNSQMVQALEHPPSHVGAGQGILFQGLPARQSNNSLPTSEVLMGKELTQGQVAELETLKEKNTLKLIQQVTALSDFKTGDATTRTHMLSTYLTLMDTLVKDQYAQKIGLLGGKAITDQDIQGTLNTAIEFHGLALDALSQTDLYVQSSPLERQRMETSYGSFAATLAKEGYLGNLKGVPLENIRGILVNTIQVTEETRSYLTNSMFFQLAAPNDQERMLTEYTSLAHTIAKRQALQQGQGKSNFRIPPEKMVPTIRFIITTEETGKAQLHGTDYYNVAPPAEQKQLDSKYETLARGLAFSRSAADPRTLITNSLNADQAYYDLQNQFGGNNYIKTMAQELADAERNIRTTAEYSPRQIAAIERGVRAQFLAQNPAYAAWLRAKTNWSKYTVDGQIYSALNKSEYESVDDMKSSGVINSDSLLVSGTSIDNSVMDPGMSMGLPRISYSTYSRQNP